MLSLRLGSIFMWPALLSLAPVNADRPLVEAALGTLPQPVGTAEKAKKRAAKKRKTPPPGPGRGRHPRKKKPKDTPAAAQDDNVAPDEDTVGTPAATTNT
jgi:hypothetical protein